MRNLLALLSMTFMILSVSCTSNDSADLVILNGKVLTVDKENPMAEAVAIKGEEIIAVGSTKKIKAYINENITKTIDANGRLVLPGFNDAHVHFRPLDPDYVELRYVNDPGVITQRVKVQVDKSKPGELVRGGHWDHELFSTREYQRNCLTLYLHAIL